MLNEQNSVEIRLTTVIPTDLLQEIRVQVMVIAQGQMKVTVIMAVATAWERTRKGR